MKILYLEEGSNDVELFNNVFGKAGFDYKLIHVSNKQEYISALEKNSLDIVISAYSLKDINYSEALELARQISSQVPFFILTRTEKENALELINERYVEIVAKKHLTQLPLKVERANRYFKDLRNNILYQEEIVKTNEVLDAIFNCLGNAVCLKDSEGRFLKVNSSFQELFGFSSEDILGKKSRDIFPEVLAKKVEESDCYVLSTKNNAQFEESYEKQDGSRRIIEVSKHPLIQNDLLTGVIGVIRDVTARKKLEDKVSEKIYLLEKEEELTSSGSFRYDYDNDILRCSLNLLRLVNLNSDHREMSLSRFMQFIYKTDREIFAAEFNKALTSNKYTVINHRYHCKCTNPLRYARTTIAKESNGSEKIYYGTVIDTSREHENATMLLDIQEKERSNIAIDLHDNLGQKLSASSLFLNSLIDRYPEDKEMERIRDLVNSTLSDVRSISNSLAMHGVLDKGLGFSLENLAHQIPSDLKFDFQLDLDENKVSKFVMTHLFRVIQEFVNNTQKFAKASKIFLRIKQDGALIDMFICDDGIGFDKNNIRAGNGLRNIEDRIRKCNGLISVQSSKGNGTRVQVKVPLK
ncbi:MAG: PAS domain S-box protein [Cyclobacteriaceae bacterium]